MVNLVRMEANDLAVSIQNLHLQPQRVQKFSQSILMSINELSSQFKLRAQASLLDMLPVYQLISQLLSMQTPTQMFPPAILGALNDFLRPEKEMIENAAKVSSSACSMLISQKSFLESFAAACRCCRHKQAFESEYSIRKLFVAAACLNPAASIEEMQRAIELEMEHLDCVSLFKNMAGSDQEKYDQHLENYLQLLSKFFGFDIESREIEDTFSAIVENFEECLDEEGANRILLRRHLAFLRSRPEWFFYKNGPLAKSHLLEAQEIAGKGSAKDQAELQLILLEAEQATKYEGASKATLNSLLDRIISLLKTLSPSDSIVALSVRVRVYEFLAKQSNQQEIFIKQMLVTLQQAIHIGNENKDQLDFRALQALAQCKFNFGFYASLCFKDAAQLKKGCEALLGISQEFWASEKIRNAAAILYDCLSAFKDFPKITLMVEGKFSLLEKLKLMLTRDIYHLAHFYLSSGPDFKCEFDKDMVPENREDMFKDESIVWASCKQKFASYFFSGNFTLAEGIIKWYFLGHYLRAKQALIEQNYIVSDYCVNIFKFFPSTTADFSESKKDISIVCSLDPEKVKVADFISKGKDFPLIQHILISQASFFLGDMDVNIQIGNGQRIQTIRLPGIIYFGKIFSSFVDQLRDLQRELAYTEVIQDTMRAFVNQISGSSFIDEVFSSNLRHLSSGERNQIIKFRRHAPSLETLCQLCITAYQFLDCHAPDPNEEGLDYLFKRARNSAMVGLMIAQSDEEKSHWSEIDIQIAEHRYRSLQYKAAVNRVQEAYVELLHANIIHISHVKDSDEKLNLLEDLFADFTDPDEDIEERIWPAEYEKSEYIHKCLCHLKLFRCMHLIVNQHVEAGITLYNKLISSSQKSKLQTLDGNVNFQLQIKPVSKLIPSPENLIRDLKIDQSSTSVSKIRSIKSQAHPQAALLSSEVSPSSSQNIQTTTQIIEESFSHQEQSEKKQVQEQARNVLRNQELKKQKKQARVASKAHRDTTVATSAPVTTSSNSVTISSASLGVIKKVISNKAKLIFDRLWQEKVPTNNPWELKSFRDDFKMTRKDALKLIRALGGTYSPDRGKGSHQVAHVPPLPKIEFNGKDVGGFIDLESGELMITLTSDEELKFYQKKHLRNILLKQGFTPHTVGLD